MLERNWQTILTSNEMSAVAGVAADPDAPTLRKEPSWNSNLGEDDTKPSRTRTASVFVYLCPPLRG